MTDELALPTGSLPLAFTIRKDVREDEEADLVRLAQRMAGLRDAVAAIGCEIQPRTALRVEREDGSTPGELILRPSVYFRPASLKRIHRVPLGVEIQPGDPAGDLVSILEAAFEQADGERHRVGDGTLVVVRDSAGDQIEVLRDRGTLCVYRLMVPGR